MVWGRGEESHRMGPRVCGKAPELCNSLVLTRDTTDVWVSPLYADYHPRNGLSNALPAHY